MDKYTRALELFQTCTESVTETDANAQFSKLIVFLHDNFDRPESTPENIAACGAICRKQVTNEDILCNPPKVIDAVYPIALSKILLVDNRLPLISTKIPEFNAFHARYGKLILESMSQSS